MPPPRPSPGGGGSNATGAGLAQALLQPRSIALVGVTDEVGAASGRVLKSVRDGGFRGRVYPVNPALATVQGERAWPDLASLPEVPDQVLVLPAGARVMETLREAAARAPLPASCRRAPCSSPAMAAA